MNKNVLKVTFSLLFVAISIIFTSFINRTDLKTLTIGSVHWIGYESIHLLNNSGVISNTDFNLKEFINVTQLMRAFERDLVDVAAVTIDEAITLSELTNDLTIIFVLDVSSGGDAIVSKKSGMELRDIKGRKVGVEIGSVGSYLLSRAFEIAEINISEIKVVPLTIDQHLKSIQHGEVDFVCTFNPVREMLLAEDGQVVFDSKSIPNEIVDVLVTKKIK